MLELPALTPFPVSFTPISPADLEATVGDIGHGSQARVFLARFQGQDVAVKTLDTDSPSSAMQREFCNELSILAQLRHENVLTFIGGCVDSSFMIVTEYCSGGNLSSLIHDPSRTYDALAITKAICSGMAYLHSQDILHRDLKADNVLLSSSGVVKVSDFGFAKQRELASQAAIQSIVGSPSYVAPEVVENGLYSNKCDVFSFGTIVWELHARMRPFFEHGAEYKNNYLLLLVDLCRNGRRAGSISTEWPAIVQTLISLCWKQSPAERPSFADITRALDIPEPVSSPLPSPSVSPEPDSPVRAAAEPQITS